MEAEKEVKKTGIQLITEERQRQIEVEGFAPEHDLGYVDDELAYAAVCYAIPGDNRIYVGDKPELWPFLEKYWKPAKCEFSHDRNYISERIRELQKAGALIAAEIDRLNNDQVKVFKFFTEDYHYACSGTTEQEAREYLTEYLDDSEILKVEEIPESLWDERTITMYEDNDKENEPFQMSIRECLEDDESSLIFTNDPEWIN